MAEPITLISSVIIHMLIFTVNGNSMYPNLQDGDYITASAINNEFSSIKLGDIVAYKSMNPAENHTIVHRIVAVEYNDMNEAVFATTIGDNNCASLGISDYVTESNYLGKITGLHRDNTKVNLTTNPVLAREDN